jgi:methylglutaconyl-CoA hydratase
VTLNKEERHNAFDQLLIDELTHALLSLDADPRVRVVVLSSAGKSFCAGADLNWMKRAITNCTPEDNLHDAKSLGGADVERSTNSRSRRMARVQGPAYGGGVGLIAACDIATRNLRCGVCAQRSEAGNRAGSDQPVRAGGDRRALQCRRYMLTAERFSAAEAYRIGLVHEIVPGEEQLDDAIGEIIDSLLKNGPNAQAECKALLAHHCRPADRRRDHRRDDATRPRSSVPPRKDSEGLAPSSKSANRTGSSDALSHGHHSTQFIHRTSPMFQNTQDYVPSPCINLCQLDRQRAVSAGAAIRSLDEIAGVEPSLERREAHGRRGGRAPARTSPERPRHDLPRSRLSLRRHLHERPGYGLLHRLRPPAVAGQQSGDRRRGGPSRAAARSHADSPPDPDSPERALITS